MRSPFLRDRLELEPTPKRVCTKVWRGAGSSADRGELEAVLVLDERGGVVASSRRARELLPELAEGSAPPPFAEAARVAYTVGDAAGTLDDVLSC